MTINITGGTVSVEDGTKSPEEFAPARKVRFELHFENPTGDDLTEAGDLASAQVDRLLGRATEAKPKRRTRGATTESGKSPADEAKTEDKNVDPEPETPHEDDDDGGLGDLLGSDDEPAVEEIADTALTDAVTSTNKATQNSVAIRKIIESYNPDPTKQFQLRQIPQSKRAEFLKKLEGVEKK